MNTKNDRREMEINTKKCVFDKNPELIELYKQGDERAGEELILLNKPLVCSIASRFYGRGTDGEDLIAIGNMGLLKAIKTFDKERGCTFSTYAVPLIFGEIRRFLRDDGMIKVSREEKRLLAKISAERERRLAQGLDVGVKSLAEALSVSPGDVVSALYSGAPIRSLDECAYDEEDSVSLGATLYDEDEARRSFDKLSLSMAIEKLCSFDKKLIILRYFKDYSQMETAKVLGVTQVKISREEKKILKILKADLQ